VSASVFRQCLAFFSRHYNVIGMDQLLEACRGAGALPPRALLITFDDGWADNAEYALPILKAAGLTTTVFVVAEGIGQRELWHECLLRAWRQRRMRDPQWVEIWESAGQNGRLPPSHWDARSAIWELINRLSALDRERRDRVLQRFQPALGRPERDQMLSPAQLRRLHTCGVTIGSHGMTHTPLPLATDATWELQGSRTALASLLARQPQEILAFSFPRGIYDGASIAAAERTGYQMIFTSDVCLNAIPGRAVPGSRESRVFGRINIATPEITDPSGRFRPELLALWLFDRPLRKLEGRLGASDKEAAARPTEISA
jgi:peptidoglycan/xylan/chitin deacetylase (PgdA/CDA1 family)